MKCHKCKKKFNEAGNIINYLYVCPHCGYAHTNTKPKRGKKVSLNDKTEGDKNGLY